MYITICTGLSESSSIYFLSWIFNRLISSKLTLATLKWPLLLVFSYFRPCYRGKTHEVCRAWKRNILTSVIYLRTVSDENPAVHQNFWQKINQNLPWTTWWGNTIADDPNMSLQQITQISYFSHGTWRTRYEKGVCKVSRYSTFFPAWAREWDLLQRWVIFEPKRPNWLTDWRAFMQCHQNKQIWCPHKKKMGTD